MRTIDLETWPRRAHFELYKDFEHPDFGVTVNVDITAFYEYLKKLEVSFTIGIVYLISRTANMIPEFRQRIRGEQVVEHQVIHPSFTILVDKDVFSFCSVAYHDDFPTFVRQAANQIKKVKSSLELEDEPGRDDWLFMTSIPWFSFTAIRHPMPSHPRDSIPRFAWGKYFRIQDSLLMPLNVDAHHGLVDGIHVGKFYQELEVILKEPGDLLGG